MIKMNLFYKLPVLIITVLSYVHTTPLDMENQRIKADISEYLTSVIEKADLTADPCEDFEKYACGNIKENTKPMSIHRMATLIDPVLGKGGPQNEAERKVHDMHLSFVNMFNKTEGDYYKLVKELLAQVHDLRFIVKENDVTDEDIAKIFLKIKHLGSHREAIDFDVTKNQLRIESMPVPKNIDSLEIILSAAGHLEIKDKIIELTEKFKNFHYHDLSEVTLTDVPIEKLKETIPSKNIDLVGCFKVFKDEFNFNSTTINIVDVETIKEVLKIFDSTDKMTVYNYLTYRYITIISKVNWDDFDFYYRYALLSRFWRDNFDDELTTNRFLNFLNSFETLIKESNDYKSFKNIQYFLDKINSKRNIAKNYKTILSDEIRDKFYEKFDIDVNKYYVNTINTFSYINTIISNIDDDDEGGRNSTAFGLLFGRFDDTIRSSIKNKPFTYLYIVLGYQLLRNIFQYNPEYFGSQYKQARKCLNESSIYTEENYDSDLFIQSNSQKTILHSALVDLLNSNSEIYKEKEIMVTENNFKKINNIYLIYILTWAQYECERNKNDFKDFVFNRLKYDKEFSEHLNCPVNSTMNSYEKCEVKKCSNKDEVTICNGKIVKLF